VISKSVFVFKFLLMLMWYLLANHLAAEFSQLFFDLPAADLSVSAAVFFQRLCLVAVIEVTALIWLIRALNLSRMHTAILVSAFYHITKHALMLLEAWFYLNAWNSPPILSTTELISLALMGLVNSVAVCAAAVLIFAKPTAPVRVFKASTRPYFIGFVGGCVYTVCYLIAGVLLQMFLPTEHFATAYANLAVPYWMPFLQLIRGAVWSLLIGWVIANLAPHCCGLTKSTVVIVPSLAGFATAQLLIPNAQMSNGLQYAHMVEIAVSMAVFGYCVCWLCHRYKVIKAHSNHDGSMTYS